MSGFTPSTAGLASVLAASGEHSGERSMLVAVIGLLGLVIIGLIAVAVVLRRRTRAQVAPPPAARPVTPIPPVPALPRARPRPQQVRGGAGGGLAVATSSAMVCPTCRAEYHGMTYCTRDARRLVPPEELLGGPGLGPMRALSRSAGLVCMACRRAYEPGLRSCPHDGNELVPFPVYNATRPRRARTTEPTGVIARICPVCGSKYDLNARFCGHDAGLLVVIN
jgi:RNA polymerase subunit RPABC4/transcription elongation factor Spt4